MSVKTQTKMANLSQKNGVYLARFRFRGCEYKKSLKTRDRQAAEAAVLQVGLTIHRLTVGLLAVPDGVDPGDFIVSGGTRTAPPTAPLPARSVPLVATAIDEYLLNLEHLAPTSRTTVAVHLRQLKTVLGRKSEGRLDGIEPRDLERFIQVRLRERMQATVAKERDTIVSFFTWAVLTGYLVGSPANGLTRVKGGGDPPPFRTKAEIDATIARGGLTLAEEWSLWDGLYLSPVEIADVLALVKRRARRNVSHLLHAIPAYTGMRRGEVLRLRWSDVEFEHDGVVARSKKQSRQAVETKRRIDLHPELKAILLEWHGKRPVGQYLACDEGSLDPLARHQAEERFWEPLKGTDWVIPARNHRPKIGFHTYRHSFASNLAGAGVDQRVIDEFMGHTTEAMRKRYRHLFPRAKRSAIESFSLASGPPGSPTTEGRTDG